VRRAATVIAIGAAGLVLCGCLDRRIRVTSEPAGARVWLNDEPIGRTPCEARFTYYGSYSVRVELDGHEPVSEGRTAHAPIHEYPGIDLVAELIPINFDHLIEWHYDLAPAPTGDAARDALRERARGMRERARTDED